MRTMFKLVHHFLYFLYYYNLLRMQNVTDLSIFVAYVSIKRAN